MSHEKDEGRRISSGVVRPSHLSWFLVVARDESRTRRPIRHRRLPLSARPWASWRPEKRPCGRASSREQASHKRCCHTRDRVRLGVMLKSQIEFRLGVWRWDGVRNKVGAWGRVRIGGGGGGCTCRSAQAKNTMKIVFIMPPQACLLIPASHPVKFPQQNP